MKNKKGMTLVEIILTIALLAVLGIIISINAVGMLNREKDKTKTEQNERIIDACLTYCNLSTHKSACTNGAKISISSLYSEGLIDENDYNVDRNRQLTININETSQEMTCN